MILINTFGFVKRHANFLIKHNGVWYIHAHDYLMLYLKILLVNYYKYKFLKIFGNKIRDLQNV